MRRYYDTRLKANLYNAGKYTSSLVMNFISIYKSKSDAMMGVYIASAIISTLYCLIWDFYMDWGLFRTREKGKKFLRTKILYPKWFYYYAMVTNTILRLFWILSIINFASKDSVFSKAEVIILVQTVAEAYRRTQWALLRVENEHINNFEKYRNVLMIPPMKDDN